MRTYETAGWRWELDGRVLRILPRLDGPTGIDGHCISIDKREFAEALVGLGIVMSAVVVHGDGGKSAFTKAVSEALQNGEIKVPAAAVTG